MKRWLIVVSLLGVCHADVALAASQSPSLFERILAVFHLRPGGQHAAVAPNQTAQKAESAQAKSGQEAAPSEATERVRAVPAIETAQPVRAEPPIGARPPLPPEQSAPKPAKIAQTKPVPMAKKASPETAEPIRQAMPSIKAAQAVEPALPRAAPAAPKLTAAAPHPVTAPANAPRASAPPPAVAVAEPRPDVASPSVRKVAAAKAAVIAARAMPGAPPVQTAQAAETTQSVYAVASIDTYKPAAGWLAPRPMPAPPAQPADTAQPLPTALAEPHATLDQAMQINRKGKSDRAPLKVAILGAPNLKAAIPAEEAPIEAPRPPVQQEPKSACNGGRRIITAYYWEGHHTASGQPFNPRAMTAAHRTLPFGTHLNVTNPRTGKTVDVVVNDRGPFVRGVSLDLSIGAAQAIGLHGTGSVCVL
jgi:rare lipoprotein A